MSEKNYHLINDLKIQINDLNQRLTVMEDLADVKTWRKQEETIKSIKEEIEALNKGGIELNDIFENMCNDIAERLDKLEAEHKSEKNLGKILKEVRKGLEENMLKMILKIEEKVINEHYDDLLLLIQKLKKSYE